MAFNFLDTVLPTGVTSSITCLYQFDGLDNGLNDKSGNGIHLTESSVLIWTIAEQGEPCVVTCSSRWLETTTTHTGVLNTTGALTIEWIGKLWEVIYNAQSWAIVIGDRASTTQALNMTCAIYMPSSAVATGKGMGWVAVHEQGAGVDEEAQFDWMWHGMGLSYNCLTRESDGKTYKLYADGDYLGSAVTTNAPDGGDGAIKLYIGAAASGTYDTHAAFNSFRYVKGEAFTAAQVLESYNRVHVA